MKCGFCGADMVGVMVCPSCGKRLDLTPLPPGDRFPLRTTDTTLESLVRREEAHVREVLGKPDGKGRGRFWASAKLGLAWAFGPHGDLIEMPVWGPVPQEIRKGQPYTIWYYHNVVSAGRPEERQTWVLYLVGKRTARRVAEVTEYPTGAVF